MVCKPSSTQTGFMVFNSASRSKNLRRQTVTSGGDGERHNVGLCESFRVKRTKNTDGSVGVRVCPENRRYIYGSLFFPEGEALPAKSVQ